MSYLQRDVNSGATLAGGAIGLIGGATIGAIGMWAAARDEKRRQQAADELKKAILNEQPPELADILLKGFGDLSPSQSYDFASVAKRYHRQKLYRFLIFNVSEEFADAYFAREAKFDSFGLQLKPTEIFERTATETKADIGSGEQLRDKFEAAFVAEMDAYVNDARKNGGTLASYHHDTLKREAEEMERQEQLKAERAARGETNKSKGFWGFGKSA
ncbi:MAG: hypothetical protein QOF14_3728 [Hyphomicrobiales bacterium]|jgi:hypothetical protein|nr:hypothetical protein [Hyphomicrobiales bacterium]